MIKNAAWVPRCVVHRLENLYVEILYLNSQSSAWTNIEYINIDTQLMDGWMDWWSGGTRHTNTDDTHDTRTHTIYVLVQLLLYWRILHLRPPSPLSIQLRYDVGRLTTTTTIDWLTSHIVVRTMVKRREYNIHSMIGICAVNDAIALLMFIIIMEKMLSYWSFNWTQIERWALQCFHLYVLLSSYFHIELNALHNWNRVFSFPPFILIRSHSDNNLMQYLCARARGRSFWMTRTIHFLFCSFFHPTAMVLMNLSDAIKNKWNRNQQRTQWTFIGTHIKMVSENWYRKHNINLWFLIRVYLSITMYGMDVGFHVHTQTHTAQDH